MPNSAFTAGSKSHQEPGQLFSIHKQPVSLPLKFGEDGELVTPLADPVTQPSFFKPIQAPVTTAFKPQISEFNPEAGAAALG